MRVVQVVRRYGPVGGMERYVWELSHALHALGCAQEIVCASIHGDAPSGVPVHTLGTVALKPRWLAAWRFARRVAAWQEGRGGERLLVHSHEATFTHHVVTFHGPPFARVRDAAPWRRVSLRVQANLWLERNMLCAPSVRAVVPNSVLIRDLLCAYYPAVRARMTHPIVPGVHPPARQPVSHGRKVIGFAGREWKRKGLPRAVRIAAALRRQDPAIELYVAGPSPDEVRHLFADWEGGYRLWGDCALERFYAEIDLLLHPALMEPFGMVITEALSVGVPVVVSECCGAKSEVPAGAVVPLAADDAQWVERCRHWLGRALPPYRRPWSKVAREHLALYRRLVGD